MVGTHKQAETIQKTVDKIHQKLADIKINYISSEINQEPEYQALVEHMEQRGDLLQERCDNLKKSCRNTQVPNSDTSLFKLVELKKCHLKTHVSPGFFIWLQYVKDKITQVSCCDSLWLQKIIKNISITEPMIMADIMEKDPPNTCSQLFVRLVKDWGRPRFYQTIIKNYIDTVGRMKIVNHGNVKKQFEMANRYVTVLKNINLMKALYTDIHGEGTMELLATLSEGVFNNDFLSYLVQIFPQQDTNRLIATMKNKSTQQQLEIIGDQMNQHFDFCSTYYKDHAPAEENKNQKSMLINEGEEIETIESEDKDNGQIGLSAQQHEEVNNIIKDNIKQRSNGSVEKTKKKTTYDNGNDRRITYNNGGNRQTPLRQGIKPSDISNVNRQILKIFHDLLHDKEIKNINVKLEGEKVPALLPEKSEETITAKMSKERKMAIMSIQLSRYGCKICIAKINDSEKIIFPHIIHKSPYEQFYPGSSSAFCPNLLRVKTANNRKTLVIKVNLCVFCLRPNRDDGCKCFQSKSKCRDCNTHFYIGGCKRCLEGVEKARVIYDKKFREFCDQTDKDLSLTKEDPRVVSMHTNTKIWQKFINNTENNKFKTSQRITALQAGRYSR